MTNKEKNRQIAYEALVILGMLALLTFICRLWPILLLIILGIFVAAETEESWILMADCDATRYSIVSDGEYMYSCAPWDHEQIVWKLIYDEDGRPIEMQLLDEDIGN